MYANLCVFVSWVHYCNSILATYVCTYVYNANIIVANNWFYTCQVANFYYLFIRLTRGNLLINHVQIRIYYLVIYQPHIDVNYLHW